MAPARSLLRLLSESIPASSNVVLVQPGLSRLPRSPGFFRPAESCRRRACPVSVALAASRVCAAPFRHRRPTPPHTEPNQSCMQRVDAAKSWVLCLVCCTSTEHNKSVARLGSPRLCFPIRCKSFVSPHFACRNGRKAVGNALEQSPLAIPEVRSVYFSCPLAAVSVVVLAAVIPCYAGTPAPTRTPKECSAPSYSISPQEVSAEPTNIRLIVHLRWVRELTRPPIFGPGERRWDAVTPTVVRNFHLASFVCACPTPLARMLGTKTVPSTLSNSGAAC